MACGPVSFVTSIAFTRANDCSRGKPVNSFPSHCEAFWPSLKCGTLAQLDSTRSDAITCREPKHASKKGKQGQTKGDGELFAAQRNGILCFHGDYAKFDYPLKQFLPKPRFLTLASCILISVGRTWLF